MGKLFKVATMLKGFYILIWTTVFKLCFSQRRMGLGNESVLGKKYLVYFVKSPYSEADDDAWLCAGAIVSPTQILTAAACLVEVNRIYAIAGYKKYVHARDIEKDKCANTWKKKVVKISVPKAYTTSTAKQLEWMNVDIGVATVEQPYDFNNQSYLAHCTYVPESIAINYDKANEMVNTRAIALGWGGKSDKIETEEKLKPKFLKEATTNIIEKRFCTKLVPKNGSKELVEKYLLCASGNGFLGEEGDDTTSDPILEKQTPNSSISNPNNFTGNSDESNEMSSRKSSLLETCQNDHGGPLITWIGAEEVILGVALNGICNPNFDCVGPRIYVSTVATADIVKCLLETSNTKRRICNDEIDDKQYQVNDIEIQWPKDSNYTLTSSVTNHSVPSNRRQNSEEEIFQVRPSKDLRSFDEPIANPDITNKYSSRKENSQEDRELSPYYELQNPNQPDQTGEPYKKVLRNQPENSPKKLMTQQQKEPQNKSEKNNFNQQQPKSGNQNQPEVDNGNQQQMASYNQPPLDPYYNQPPMDSYFDQPQTELKSPPNREPYSQPQTKPNNHPPDKPNNQKPIDQKIQQMDSFNQPNILNPNNPNLASQNQLQLPINNPESISSNPQQPTNNNNQQEPALKPLQTGPAQEDLHGQPTLRDPAPKPLDKPPAELESMKSSTQPAQKPLDPIQYSNKEPLPSYSNAGIKTSALEPAESYDPLDIIMAENEDEELTFKHATEHPFKLPPVERHKLPRVDAYMPQPFKPSLGKPFEQPQLSQNYIPQSPPYAQPSGQEVGHVSGQSFDTSHTLNVLRERPRDPLFHPSKGEPQTFEQMYSQLHAEPEPAIPAPTPREETFDEIYKNLHDGGFEEPPANNFQPQNEQGVEQRDARMIDESPANTEAQDAVQMRQQAPIVNGDFT